MLGFCGFSAGKLHKGNDATAIPVKNDCFNRCSLTYYAQ